MKSFMNLTMALVCVAVGALVLVSAYSNSPKGCNSAGFQEAYVECLRSGQENSAARTVCVKGLNERAVDCVSKQVGAKNEFEQGLTQAVDFLRGNATSDAVMQFMSTYNMFN